MRHGPGAGAAFFVRIGCSEDIQRRKAQGITVAFAIRLLAILSLEVFCLPLRFRNANLHVKASRYLAVLYPDT